ncbi:hypothetical protein CYMTET_32125 [Cymbomonas tetramitiformis]|uniref:Uncharacterized protein n=1 Tax=Cymbomonas tetramitiformis TaxID=36881 RepID=A0AAE0FFM1_9CHLO|nr:hypothetical protein CYMTET_46407 [Cymbomonas tetramitiformis]KAK3243966.1 hypothetical protein CYMTET_46406 [Cymbomonas tetramitiformis]KAK3258849.1 hypothetical protein CYMTET_32125 [Cymbomonas tetramitiformis]
MDIVPNQKTIFLVAIRLTAFFLLFVQDIQTVYSDDSRGISSKLTSAQHSQVVGLSKVFESSASINFVIEAKDATGTKKTYGGDTLLVTFKGPSIVTAQVEDLKNGDYEIKAKLTDPGVYDMVTLIYSSNVCGENASSADFVRTTNSAEFAACRPCVLERMKSQQVAIQESARQPRCRLGPDSACHSFAEFWTELNLGVEVSPENDPLASLYTRYEEQDVDCARSRTHSPGRWVQRRGGVPRNMWCYNPRITLPRAPEYAWVPHSCELKSSLNQRRFIAQPDLMDKNYLFLGDSLMMELFYAFQEFTKCRSCQFFFPNPKFFGLPLIVNYINLESRLLAYDVVVIGSGFHDVAFPGTFGSASASRRANFVKKCDAEFKTLAKVKLLNTTNLPPCSSKTQGTVEAYSSNLQALTLILQRVQAQGVLVLWRLVGLPRPPSEAKKCHEYPQRVERVQEMNRLATAAMTKIGVPILDSAALEGSSPSGWYRDHLHHMPTDLKTDRMGCVLPFTTAMVLYELLQTHAQPPTSIRKRPVRKGVSDQFFPRY